LLVSAETEVVGTAVIGLVEAVVVKIGVITAGVVALGLATAGVVEVDGPVPQLAIRKAQMRRITSGINTFFISGLLLQISITLRYNEPRKAIL